MNRRIIERQTELLNIASDALRAAQACLAARRLESARTYVLSAFSQIERADELRLVLENA